MADVAIDIAEATSGVTHKVDGEQMSNGSEDVVRQVVQLGGDAFADKAPVDATRGLKVDPISKLTTATVPAQTAQSATSVQVLAINADREGLVLVNDSGTTCYVKFGTTAATTSYTYRMPSYSTLSLPDSDKIYTGRIDAIWAAAGSGKLAVTELEA